MSIPSPYNFVPAFEQVQWAEAPISQDHPWQDGVCGSFEITVTTETPTFVRGTEKPARAELGEEPYKVDGQWALPGSSIRGLVRSTVEIASFSRLGPVNDLRFGFRNLQNRPLYGVHMAAIANRVPTPKVSACWLKRTGLGLNEKLTEANKHDVVAILDVVDFAKVEHDLLKPMLVKPFDLGARESAPARYAALGVKPGELKEVEFPLHPQVVRYHGDTLEGYRALGEFRRSAVDGEKKKGILVITGQPSERTAKAPKRHDFLFYGVRRLPIAVTRQHFTDFEFIHSADQEKHGQRSTPNPEWAFWQRAFDEHKPVPVFAIFKPHVPGQVRELRSFGLASTFRLAFEYTTGDAAANTQQVLLPDGSRDARLDYAESLFGRVPKDERHRARTDVHEALKGRVSFDTLVSKDAQLSGPVTAVFGAPKPSYYPNYIENSPAAAGWGTAVPNGGPVIGDYKTLMDGNARLRGWKRYRLQAAVANPPLPDKVKDKQKSIFRPVKAGATFKGKVRVHNVRLHELGALLWAIKFGEDEHARHALGLAKPYGYGRIKITVEKEKPGALIANDPETINGEIIPKAIAAFVDHMERWAKEKAVPAGWRKSLHIETLLHLAKPVVGDPMELRYPTLKPNEFTTAIRPANRWTLQPGLPFEQWLRERVADGVQLPPIPSQGRMSAGGAQAANLRPQPGYAPQAAPPPLRPAPAAPPADDTAESCARKVTQTMAKGGQYSLVREWIQAGGPLEAVRRQGALMALGPVNEKMRAKQADIAEWLSAKS